MCMCMCMCMCICIYCNTVYIYIHIIANQKMRNQTDKTLRIWGAGIDLDVKS